MEFVEYLKRPEAYPHKPTSVEFRQTHISWIFLAGDLVYKVKKPVDFGFLDFTTVEKRKFFCEKEVELNRRLCPNIYLGVVPVVRTSKGYAVEEEGEVVDWAVKMRRLPEEGMMSRLIKIGALGTPHIDLLVKKLVPFYREARTGPEVNRYGSLEVVGYNVEENFEQTREFVGKALSELRYRYIVGWSRAFMRENAELFEARVRGGFVREGHGDLYSANICYDDLKEVYVFDCIEFNERFRCGDAAQDLAFLAMDLDFHGLKDLSNYFVNSYAEGSGDGDLFEVLDFYKCYRAYVRGKIGCFTWASEGIPEEERRASLEAAKRYFGLAYSYAGGRPLLLVVFGLTGTGKTTLAKVLSQRLLADHLNSDVIRKELAGIPAEERRFEPYGRGIYSREMTEKTYEEMIRRAKEALSDLRDVVLDATFKDEALRRRVIDACKESGAEAFFVWCDAPEEVVKRRLSERLEAKTGPSDGRWEIYQAQKKDFSPPKEVPSERLLKVDTSVPPETLVEEVLHWLEGKLGINA